MLIKPDYISDKKFEVLSMLITENKMYMQLEKYNDKYFFLMLRSDTCLGLNNTADLNSRIGGVMWVKHLDQYVMSVLATLDSCVAFYLKENFKIECSGFIADNSKMRWDLYLSEKNDV